MRKSPSLGQSEKEPFNRYVSCESKSDDIHTLHQRVQLTLKDTSRFLCHLEGEEETFVHCYKISPEMPASSVREKHMTTQKKIT